MPNEMHTDAMPHRSTPAAMPRPCSWIDDLRLSTIDPDRQAGVAIASLPLPAQEPAMVAFSGMPSQAVPVAWYPAEEGSGPGEARQVLVMGIADDGAPETVSLAVVEESVCVTPRATAAATPDPQWAGPTWQAAILDEKKTGVHMREVNELVLAHGGRRVGLRLGIELADGGFHWWEWLQVEQLWSGPVCTAMRAAGYIGVTTIDDEDLLRLDTKDPDSWFHRHNWLYAEVYAMVFANGLVKVTARHINSRFFDQGRDLEGFVPVIAFSVPDAADLPEMLLDGSRTDVALGADPGGIQLDLDRAADLVSPEHPGRLRSRDGLVIVQPYEGVECILGDGEPVDRWQIEAVERRMWKGMGRSVGFDLSFADRPIRTRRYLPPYGWMGYAGALWPDAVLPARGPLEATCDEMADHGLKGPFAGRKPFCSGRYFQPSALLDGECAHGLMRQAYRTARRDLYEAALHHAYAFADTGIDHADFTQGIVGMHRGSISLVLQRNIGMLAAYLETGDPYLLRCAESLADTAYTIDRANWPRRSYGRDAAYIRSLTRLYDVTGETFYLRRAGEACRRIVQCQHPNGSFTDQGATIGPHASMNEVVKPWMNSILSEVLVDYLERAGSDPAIERCLLRTADWLLGTLQEDADGPFFPYEVAWGRNEYEPTSRWRPEMPPLAHPFGDYQLDYNARTLLWVSRTTGDPKYALAWQATYRRRLILHDRSGKPYYSTYGDVKVAENFPWHEAHLWGARREENRLTASPFFALLEIGREATVELPDGRSLRLRRTETGVEQIDGDGSSVQVPVSERL